MPDAIPDVGPRSARRLLADPRFGPFFVGKLLATMGIWIHNVAAAILVHRLTGSALLVGAVSVGQFLPQLLLAPWSGARADRRDRRRQVLVGVTVSGSGSLGLALWAASSGLDGAGGATPLIAAATVVGIGFALSGPAMQALVPQLVRPAELTTAIAMTTVPFTIARIVGPALGALLVTRGGAVAAFGSAATLSAIYLVTLARLRPRPRTGRPTGERDLLAGWRFARAHPSVARALLAVAIVGVGADPVITLTPSLAEALGAPGDFVGALASAFGAGASIGFVLLGPTRRRLGLGPTATLGLAVLAGAWLATALAPSADVTLVVLTVGGAGMTLALPTLTAIVQRATPDDVRGRVMALWSIAFLGSRPLTASVTGALADLTSVRVALATTAAVIAVGAVVTRQPRPPEPAPSAAPPADASATTTSASVV